MELHFEVESANLSNRYKFTYDQQSNTLNKTLLQDLPKNFFPNVFSSITGIVGKNGAGKSNALELICNTLKGTKTALKFDFFIILEDHNPKTRRMELKGYYSFASKPAPHLRGITFAPHPGSIPNVKVIFFSNVFDNRRNDFDNEVSDLSANARNGRPTNLNSLSSKDFRDQISLINSIHYSDLNIEAPKNVQIISKIWTETGAMLLRDLSRFGFTDVGELRKTIRKRMNDLKNPVSRFIVTLKFSYFFEIIYKYNKHYVLLDGVENIFSDANINVNVDKNTSTEKLAQDLIDYIGKKFKDNGNPTAKSKKLFWPPFISRFKIDRASAELSERPKRQALHSKSYKFRRRFKSKSSGEFFR